MKSPFKLFPFLIVLFIMLIYSCNTECTHSTIGEYQLKVKPTINLVDYSDTDPVGVANVPFKIAVIKKYCNGKLGKEEFLEGQTGANGVWVAPGTWTLYIDSTLDEVIVNVYHLNEEAIGSCSFPYSNYKSDTYFTPNCSISYTP